MRIPAIGWGALCITTLALVCTTSSTEVSAAKSDWEPCLEDNGVLCVKPDRLGWTHAERLRFYHISQGSRIMPFTFFQALREMEVQRSRVLIGIKERAGTLTDEERLIYDRITDQVSVFNADALRKLGVLTDPADPDGLPIGLARTETPSKTEKEGDRYTGQYHLGGTCALCHTSEIRYAGDTYRVTGGAALLDVDRLLTRLLEPLALLVNDERALRDFADRVSALEAGPGPANDPFMAGLRQRIWRVLEMYTLLQTSRHIPHTQEQFGRMAAFDRGQKLIPQMLFIKLADLDWRALRFPLEQTGANAPVSFPPLWDTWRFDYVHYNHSTEHPKARNLLQATALGARIDHVDDANKWEISCNLDRIEELMRKLRPPPWPGAVDETLHKKGESLYQTRCERCHLAPDSTSPDPDSVRRPYTKRIALRTFPYFAVGTDSTLALNTWWGLTERNVVAKSTGEMLRALPDCKPELYDGVQNKWKGDQVYRARPLHGMWSTGPYLHNGSVPTLWHLLGNQRSRPTRFCVGGHELNEASMGFVFASDFTSSGTDLGCEARGMQEFDTEVIGNSNRGHIFEGRDLGRTAYPKNGIVGPELSDDDRRALIEYLKTLNMEDAP